MHKSSTRNFSLPQGNYDLAIIGGGLVGASLALALEPLALRYNWRIALLESTPPATNSPASATSWQPSFDERNTALAWGSKEIYTRLGLWQQLKTHAYPIEEILVTNKGRLGSSQLLATQQQVEALGYVVPNKWLGQVLWQALARCSGTEIIAPAQIASLSFPNPDEVLVHGGISVEASAKSQAVSTELKTASAPEKFSLSAKLAILADGGRSPLKQQLGIADTTHDYGQTAIIANVELSQAHLNVAYERFTPTGALALLPLAGRQMALIWTQPTELAAASAALPAAEFLHELQTAFGVSAGRFVQVGQRFSYPLYKVQAQEQARRNLALVGNTAHYLHPVAGQGYNLALRGVTSLVAHLEASARKAQAEEIAFHPGSLEVLNAWQAERQADQAQIIGFSHNLIQLFAQNSTLKSHAQGAGLIGFNLISPLKNWLSKKAMGL